jgi:RNA polymerase sigma factor (sigma-70 family)
MVMVLRQTLTIAVLAAYERDALERLQAGEPAALREIFHLRSKAAYWAALGVVGSPSAAEEVTQETFLKLWEKRSSIVPVGASMVLWIVTTSRHLALNRRRYPLASSEIFLAAEVDPEDKLEGLRQTVETTEAGEHLNRIVAAMPPGDREVFAMCLADDLSYEQAVQRLGVTGSSMRNRLSRLEVRLRSELTLMNRGVAMNNNLAPGLNFDRMEDQLLSRIHSSHNSRVRRHWAIGIAALVLLVGGGIGLGVIVAANLTMQTDNAPYCQQTVNSARHC